MLGTLMYVCWITCFYKGPAIQSALTPVGCSENYPNGELQMDMYTISGKYRTFHNPCRISCYSGFLKEDACFFFSFFSYLKRILIYSEEGNIIILIFRFSNFYLKIPNIIPGLNHDWIKMLITIIKGFVRIKQLFLFWMTMLKFSGMQ